MQRRPVTPSDLHGSARWLTSDEMLSAKLYQEGGVVLGHDRGALLSFHGDGHLLTFAPSGAGKGIGFVQPNLVMYPGSMIVLDPKGENADVSARHRCEQWRQRVVVLDPFKQTKFPSDRYNPLAPLSFLPPDDVLGELRDLCAALIPSRSGRDETHWINGARMFVEGLLLFLLNCQDIPDRHLVRLHDLAFGSERNLTAVFDALQNLAARGAEHGVAIDRETARICKAYGNWWFGREPKERSYFLSIAHQELAWLGDSVWEDILTGEEAAIDPKGEPTTVYLVLPWKRLKGYRNWLRVMVSSLMSAVIATPGKPDAPVLFLLDEAFLGLGRLEIVLEAAAILRGEGGRIALVYQDMPQLKSLYADEWEGFMANAGATLFFGVNDMTGADYVSRRCGTETRFVPGSTTGQARQLRQASEAITVPEDEMVCFLRNLSPARIGRLDVRADERFRPHLDPNPRYQKATAGARRGGLSGQQPRPWVPIDIEAEVKRAPVGTGALDDRDRAAVATETEDDGELDWDGLEAPLPPLPPDLSRNEVKNATLCAALSEQYKQYVFWSEQHSAFGYLDDFGMFKPVG